MCRRRGNGHQSLPSSRQISFQSAWPPLMPCTWEKITVFSSSAILALEFFLKTTKRARRFTRIRSLTQALMRLQAEDSWASSQV